MNSISDPQLSLNGIWELRHGPQQRASAEMAQPEIPDDWPRLPAAVPGLAELDLIEARLLPRELWRGTDIYRLRAFEKHQWWFQLRFTVEAFPAGTQWELCFEGVDTLATVWLNGIRLARLENMFIPHTLTVSDCLRAGENHLVVGIDSAVLAGMQARHPPGVRAHDANWESLTLRKAAHAFGWDIFPRAVTHGIWRGVSLRRQPEYRFEEVSVATRAVDPGKRTARLWVTWRVEAPPQADLDAWSVRFHVLEDGAEIHEETRPVLGRHALFQPEIRGVDAWWPRGYGPARLYTLCFELLNPGGEVVARRELRTGFRTVRLEKTDCLDAEGAGRFAFVVNGEELFIKGTNWVPLDAFHSRDAERLQETLDLACDLNCNMIRCWGGGVYEDHPFFDRCDEAGILVWQDFMLACSLYPQTPELHARIREEAESVVSRLRHHPSLALWAGNNEIDLFYSVLLPHLDPNAADEISRRVLPSVCRQFDPWRDYLPSSPYFAPALHALGSPYARRPEDHLWWGPRDDFKAPYFRDSPTLFVSEIGFGGIPCRRSLEKMMTPEGLWPWRDNPEWMTHIVRPQPRGQQFTWRLAQLEEPIRHLFGQVPEDMDGFVMAGQIAQAEAMKYFIERWRIRKGHCAGILWWNLRDGWPVISSGVVDYFGEKTLAYHAIRRVQSDVCVMLDETQAGEQALVLVNDTRRPVSVSVRVQRGGEPVWEGKTDSAPHGRELLGRIPMTATPGCLRLEWEVDGVSSHLNHYLEGPRPWSLAQCRRWYRELGFPEPPA